MKPLREVEVEAEAEAEAEAEQGRRKDAVMAE
jgi:hypothetical protein